MELECIVCYKDDLVPTFEGVHHLWERQSSKFTVLIQLWNAAENRGRTGFHLQWLFPTE